MRQGTIIDSGAVDADETHMEKPEPQDPDTPRECAVCGRDAVTIDRDDTAMCARHASIFVTMDHRRNLSEKARVVR